MEADSMGWRLLLTIILVGVLTYVKARPDCHCTNGCDVNFRCTPGSHCVDGWSGPTCQIENIAFNKRTHQSGNFNDCPWAGNNSDRCGNKASDLAVDGWKSSTYWSGTCTHTADKRPSAHWTVDLGVAHQINNITIYFSHPDRMSPFRVDIDNVLCYEWSNSNKPRSPVSITCSTPVYGRNVKIELPYNNGENRILNLCEVEIHECSNGTFGQLCNQVCNCENRSEICNKTTGHCDSGCAVGYTGTGCQIENIALRKTTEQSSTVNDCKWANSMTKRLAVCGNKISGLAVDGRASSDYWSGTCTHTTPGQEPVWWSVDLGKSYFIKNMKIYFPITKSRRMTHFRVKVDDSECYERKGRTWPTSPLTISCNTTQYGRNVTIQLGSEASEHILNLCEVEIYHDCRDGSFGNLCDLACNCRNVSEVCHKDTGRCLSGCTDGYTGLGCQSECADGQFGGNCTSVCYCRDNSEVCNKVNGLCTSGCPDEYTGPGCQKGCKNGYYGNECRETCGSCAGGSVCHPVTGMCNDGCEANWIGEQCKECENGSYGYNCSLTCGKCLGGAACDKINGECNGRCQEGFSLPLCQECADGQFGGNCTSFCYCRDYSEVCNKVTGLCTSGCPDGYTGPGCQKSCKNGYYGNECRETCGSCAGGSVCHPVTGRCNDGCEANWIGEQCKVCKNGIYGDNCSLTCGKCLDGAACDKINGECTGRCQEGFTLPLCQDCLNGYYGKTCKRCGHCRGSTTCNKDSGQCPEGCLPGWKGNTCLKVCKNGIYGDNCSLTCGKCLGGATCDKINGKCTGRCQEGFSRPLCQDCLNGYYGKTCKRCGHCRGSTSCNKDSGQCPEGCLPGWKGNKCRKECENGTYDYNCSLTCGKCLDGAACDKINGECTGRCQEGFSLPLCQECEDGFYGLHCSKTCGRCQGNSSCDKDTGQCQDGCMAGWKGGKCEQECEEGSYGPNCSKRCGQCVAQCNKVDGSCDKGCMKGWTGHKCESECPDGMHGLNCSKNCGQCFLGGACNKTTGHCPLSKCEKGWKGHLCKEDCNNTKTYGHNCNETCGWCLGGVCDPVTGYCPGECHPMYEGVACQLKRPVNNTLSSVGMVLLYSLIAILVVVLLVAFYILKRRQTKTPAEESLDLTSPIVIRNDNAAVNRGAGPSTSSASTSGASAFDGKEDDDITYMNVDSTKVKVPDFHQYITKRTDKFAFEYGRLPKGLQYPHSVAANQANTTKNRYKAMYPYDHSRVILDKIPGVKHSDYINASYIDTYSKKKFYIATQGPKPVTVGDFWRMVWQEESSIIVMLTCLAEGKRVKCEQYWPDEDKPMTRGDLHITNEGCVQKADYVIRELTVHNTKMDQRHHVTQLQYVTWPDHGVPSAPALVRFWKTFKSMTVLNKKPFIIHCSAGVGRTGTFIALDVLMGRAREYGVLDVFDYVTRMREDRVSMVQTKEQYLFLHQAILEALRSENTNMTPAKFETRFTTDMLSSPLEQTTLQEQWKSLQELHRVLHDTEVAGSLLPENIRKTRNKEVLPADKSRPLLSLPVPETNDYINAVFVPSESVEKGLVVTQTPLPWTVLDFWRLVIEYDVRTVVNLELDACSTTTDDEATFWPQTVTELNCGPFVVSKIGTKEGETTYVSLQVWQKDTAESTKHDVQLLYMSDWLQSQDTPTKTSDFLHLLNEVNILEKKNTSGPIAVMCRDGATRCGLFCAAYNTIQRLKTDNEIDIYLTVRHLQAIRPSFLPSYAQYKFCYQMVKEFQRTVAAVYENFQA